MTPAPRSATKVAIVDDHALFAEALALTLELEGFTVSRAELPATGGSMAAILTTILRGAPRLVLLDLDLGRFGDGTRMIEPLARSGAAVIVLTGSRERSRWGECLLRGAIKVCSKTAPLNEIVATVRRVHEGLPLMARDERQELIREWHRQVVEVQDIKHRIAALTRREQEVLAELMVGHQVREIAQMSVVSEATVRTQVKSILAKLEMSSQLAAVGAAYKIGWQLPTD